MKRVKNVTLGDLGAAVGAFWEGLGHWSPFNTEVKTVDTTQSATPLSSAGSIVCLSETAQGVAANQRNGESIKLVALEIRDQVAVTTSNSAVRRIIFIDWDQAGTAPTVAQLLRGAGLSTADAPFMPFERTNLTRFEVLDDELLHVDTVQRPLTVAVRKFRLSSHVRYLGSTAAAASDGEGSVYVAYVSATSSNYPTVTFTARLSFIDN